MFNLEFPSKKCRKLREDNNNVLMSSNDVNVYFCVRNHNLRGKNYNVYLE